ncbi:ADP-ribosylglycohydrolase family protein [bacterium]|nr:ADP-ribosylglycohydrolase family protein [bacterium]
MSIDKIRGAILGAVIGDALGVPFEFLRRDSFSKNEIKQMKGWGTHNQPPGTWSDDSSMSLILIDIIITGYTPKKLMDSFIKWKNSGLWTPHGELFDIGISTQNALNRYESYVISPTDVGGDDVCNNGNGALMRIYPIAFWLLKSSFEKRLNIVREISSLTHRHIRSIIASMFYIEYLILLLNGKDKFTAFYEVKKIVAPLIPTEEIQVFKNIFNENFIFYPRDQINSGGYVIDTLEAFFWIFLNYGNYQDAVIESVLLGDDTDTTATVVGCAAGIYYGVKSIPHEWIEKIVKLNEIEELSKKFAIFLNEN